MNKNVLLVIFLLVGFSSALAEFDRGITSSSSSLVNTSLSIGRKVIRRNGNIRFNFRLEVDHLTDGASCTHFLELIPVNMAGTSLDEVVFKRVAITSGDSIVRWRSTVEPTRRRANRRSEIHVRISSSCTEDTTTETINSNVASRYSCTSDRTGIAPARQARQLRNSRVRTRAN